MCYIYAGKINKAGLAKLAQAGKTNVHGFGLYCYDCKLIEKTIVTKNYIKYYTKHKGHNVIAHFRLASAGKINLGNVQPIYHKKERFILFHNGTNKFVKVPKGSIKSDTHLLFDYIIKNYSKLNMLEFLKKMQKHDSFGNYILIDSNKEKTYVSFNSGQLNSAHFTTSGDESFRGTINLGNGKTFIEQIHKLKKVQYIQPKQPKQLSIERYNDLEETVRQMEAVLKTEKEQYKISLKNSIYKTSSVYQRDEFECIYDVEISDQHSTQNRTIKVVLPFIPNTGHKTKMWKTIKKALDNVFSD